MIDGHSRVMQQYKLHGLVSLRPQPTHSHVEPNHVIFIHFSSSRSDRGILSTSKCKWKCFWVVSSLHFRYFKIIVECSLLHIEKLGTYIVNTCANPTAYDKIQPHLWDVGSQISDRVVSCSFPSLHQVLGLADKKHFVQNRGSSVDTFFSRVVLPLFGLRASRLSPPSVTTLV